MERDREDDPRRPAARARRCATTAWREGGLDALYDDLGARDFLRGRRVSVDGVEGTAQMIDRSGRLAVATASGPLLVESGEVLYVA